ncbi:MAG: hypothetical protein GY861_02400 [bacterium]|nr:hypothetical protein [bacterium]
MKCFHGTTKKGLNAILANAGVKPNAPWVCSDNDGEMYVWPQNKLEDSYDFEEQEQFICHAFESAEIQAVVSEEVEVFVLEMDIPNDLLEDDYSCDNMADVASYLPMDDFTTDMIVKVYTYKLNKWNAPFVISNLLNNEHFNTYSIDENLLEAAEAIQQAKIYKDPIDFYDFVEYDFKA